jgi:PAS domain S-box-containing protein
MGYTGAPHVSATFLPSILHSVPVAIASLDLEGRIRDANQALVESSGHTLNELKGVSFSAFLDPRDEDATRSAFARLASGACEMYAASRRYRMRDGDLRDVDLRVTLVRDEAGTPQSCLAVLRDVTEQKRALEEAAEIQQEGRQMLFDAQHAHLQVEAANRVKDAFLATLAHELRTPINAVILWAHILRSKHDDPDTIHALDAIEGSAVAQARLINDVLDASRIIIGKIRLQLELVDLTTVIRAALESVAPAAAAKTLAVTSELPGGLPTVRGDAHRLEQVFWHLLSNAVKFTEPGGAVSVTVRLNGPCLQADVTDTRQGNASEILPFVFERFMQGDPSTSQSPLGLGLGLAIVRRLVELHGGTVTAESGGPGRGSTFRVEIPLAS